MYSMMQEDKISYEMVMEMPYIQAMDRNQLMMCDSYVNPRACKSN